MLREQRSGLIIQFSSIGGRVGGSPGLGSYQAAKFAVDGLSRVLAAELAPFGVPVMVVEPSGFATDWAGASMSEEDIAAEYREAGGFLNPQARVSEALTAGDPQRAASILVTIAHEGHSPSHLLLGQNAVDFAINYSENQLVQARTWEDVSRSADFGQPFPVLRPI